MKLFKIRLLCGTEGLYETEMEMARQPFHAAEAVKLLLDAFGDDGRLMHQDIDRVQVADYPLKHSAVIQCEIIGVPSTALVMPIN